MQARRGATLVELTIALTMLGVGLLALAAGAAALARHATRAALDARAADAVRDLVERTAAAGCGAPVSGDSVIGPLRARWRAADDSGTRSLHVVLSATSGAGRPHVVATRLLCAGS